MRGAAQNGDNIMTQMNPSLRQRVALLRWGLPLALGLLTVLYEVGPGRWIHDFFSASAYFDLDIAFYGLVAPTLTFATLTLLGHWLDKKQQAEQQARDSEQRLAAIMIASADAIITLDPSGRIDSWNRGAEQLFGYAAAQMRGHSLSDLLNS